MALPPDAPSFTVDQTAGTVTFTGTVDWVNVQNGLGLARTATTYSITVPIAGTPFDAGFTPPTFTSTTVQLPGTASLSIGDPKFFTETDARTGFDYGLYSIPPGTEPAGTSPQGLIFSDIIDLFPVAGGLDGDQTYSFVVSMNSAFTAIDSIDVFLRVRTPLAGTDFFSEEFYRGSDPFSAPVQLGDIPGISPTTPTAGDDVLDFSAATTPIDVNALDGNDTVTGGSANDTLRGASGDDTLRGRDGNDDLQGGQGNDTINGNNGNDTLNGGQGRDTMQGGQGRDTLQGGDGKDTLKGNTGLDTLLGGRGNDDLSGGAGADSLNGGRGNDVLAGGNAGDDLTGGEGDDTLSGGIGGDDFIFEGHIDADTITDYVVGTDELHFSQGLWSGTRSANNVVNTFASVVGNDVVFDFGGGESITLLGINSTAGLAGDIVFI